GERLPVGHAGTRIMLRRKSCGAPPWPAGGPHGRLKLRGVVLPGGDGGRELDGPTEAFTLPSRVVRILAAGFATGGARRLGLDQVAVVQDLENLDDDVAHLAALDDEVEHAVLEQELGALEPFRQLLADGLLDDARAGEAD